MFQALAYHALNGLLLARIGLTHTSVNVKASAIFLKVYLVLQHLSEARNWSNLGSEGQMASTATTSETTPPNGALPPAAAVVIVGGGVAGTALAYQLAELGLDGVVVLEQNRLGAGTTWHAAGAVGRMRTTASLARLNERSAALYERVSNESGLETGWRRAGSLTIARSAERMLQLRRAGTMARRFGVDVREIAADETRERWPLAWLGDVVGGVWLPDDGIVDPLSLVQAIADEARRRGVLIVERVRVTEVRELGGRVTGVSTSAGEIDAETVVLCGGMWTAQLAASAGVSIPLHPVEHHYVLSNPVGSDVDALPLVRDPDGSIYFRGKGDALMLGAFQETSKPWLVDQVPDDFAFQLLEPDWEHFAAPLKEGFRRLPLLESLGIAKFVNGPESFTPDGNPLVGETAEIRRLFVSAGFNSSGLAYSGGVGEALAQWIVLDEPPGDLWTVDIRRFRPEQSDRGFLRERAVEVLGTHMRMAYPNVEFRRARELLRSPLHERLADAGACFGEKMGVERPNWFAAPGEAPVTRYSFMRQNWFERSRAEHLATRADVAVFDQSGFGKFEIVGPDALAVLQRVCANDVDVDPGRAVYTAMLTSRGTFASDLTVLRTGPDSFMMVTGTAQSVSDRAWLRRHVEPGEQLAITDRSAELAVLGVMGPRSRELLGGLCDTALSNDAFPFATTQPLSIAGVGCRAVRITYVGELGWELYVPVEAAGALYDALRFAGQPLGLVNAGHYAINSLRLEKGYRAWGADVSMDYTPIEAGLGFAVSWEKSTPFIGRHALWAQRNGRPPTRRMLSFVLEDSEPVLWGGELIFRDGECVGHTTSGAYGHSLGASVALGYVAAIDGSVEPDALLGHRYEVDLAGERHLARATISAPFDPARERVLG
jgi:glycine cleavage system aminomethyltransferase T/glycine/D-amino acid oxidase-like deaminating enzyme